jgi:rubrerythrin
MTTEQEKTLQVLQTAIQMEIDGKAFYLKASGESKNAVGKQLLKTLAGEEDRHRRTFAKIYDALRAEKAWPKIALPSGRDKVLKTILTGASVKKTPLAKAEGSEMAAVETAIGLEVKTYTYYTEQAKIARYDVEKDFYQRLAAEERGHHLVLADYLEFIKDPQQWYYVKEHSNVDGG